MTEKKKKKKGRSLHQISTNPPPTIVQLKCWPLFSSPFPPLFFSRQSTFYSIFFFQTILNLGFVFLYEAPKLHNLVPSLIHSGLTLCKIHQLAHKLYRDVFLCQPLQPSSNIHPLSFSASQHIMRFIPHFAKRNLHLIQSLMVIFNASS